MVDMVDTKASLHSRTNIFLENISFPDFLDL